MRLQQAAHPGRVHFDAEEVDRRAAPCAIARRRLAHAAADLEHARRARGRTRGRNRAAPRWNGDAVARQQRVERALLRRRHPALPQHEAADRPRGARRGIGDGPTGARRGCTVHAGSRRRGACASRRVARSSRDRSSRRSSVAGFAAPAAVYSIDERIRRPSTSRAASDQASAGFHATPCARRRATRATRASSLTQRVAQKSAVTSRCRSGESLRLGRQLDLAAVGPLQQRERDGVAVGRVEQHRIDRGRDSPTGCTSARRSAPRCRRRSPRRPDRARP